LLHPWYDDITNTYGPGGTSTYDELKAKDQRFAVGVGYLGLQKIGFTRIAADTRMYNLGGAKVPSWDGSKMITIYPFFTGQRITWSNAGLTLDCRLKQRYNLNDDRWNYGPAMHSRFTARYEFTDTPFDFVIAPKIGFNHFANTGVWGDNPSDMRFDEGIVDWEECDREKGGWGLNPAVDFLFGADRNARVEMGYSLKVNTGVPDDTISIREKSRVNHAFYLFVKVSVGKIVEKEDE